MRLATIYGLASTRDGKIRYVGQTIKDLATRWRSHKFEALSGRLTYLYNWMRKEWGDGYRVFYFAIEERVPYNDAEERWVQWYRKHGAELVNQTDGGRGHNGYSVSDETRRKQSVAARGVKRNLSAEEKERRRQQILAVTADPLVRAKIAAANRGKKKCRDAIAKMVATRRAKGNYGFPDGWRERQSKRIREWWAKRKAARVVIS